MKKYMAAVTLKHVLTVPAIILSYLNSKSVVRFVWIAIIENSSFAYAYDRNIESFNNVREMKCCIL